MLKKIKTSQLKVGMYVNLSGAWYSHPFFTSHFTITTPKQIQKLIDYGIKVVDIDEAKGLSAAETMQEAAQAPVEDSKKINSDNLTIAASKLEEALADKNMSPEQKAAVIHMQTTEMIKSVWNNPAADKIAEFKRGVFGIVNTMLSEQTTHDYLLKLASSNFNTYIHSVNVGIISICLAKGMLRKSDGHNMHALGVGFFLHDLGKAYIDESLIQKPGKFTPEEMSLMRKHPAMGLKLLSEAKQMDEESRIIIMQHHERRDATGYPRRLLSKEIHLYAKICAVADVYDALVSKRPYKEQVKPFDALKIIKDDLFDPSQKEIFEKFVLLFMK